MRPILISAVLGLSVLFLPATSQAGHWVQHGGYSYYVDGGFYYYQSSQSLWYVWTGYAWAPSYSPLVVVPQTYYGYGYRPYYYRQFVPHHHHNKPKPTPTPTPEPTPKEKVGKQKM